MKEIESLARIYSMKFLDVILDLANMQRKKASSSYVINIINLLLQAETRNTFVHVHMHVRILLQIYFY